MDTQDRNASFRRLQRRYEITLTAATAAAVLLLGVFAASARACDDVTTPAAVERLDTLWYVQGAIQVADAYWINRGHALSPARVFVSRGPRALGVDGCADTPGDRVWVTENNVAFLRSVLKDHERRPLNGGNTATTLAWFCSIVVHERGHNAGLGHDAGGIMAIGHGVPRGCRTWALAAARTRQYPGTVIRRVFASSLRRARTR